MKKLVEYGRDDHPEDDPERAQHAWAVTILDDCDGCGDLRIEFTLEDVGRPGYGHVAHFSVRSARHLRGVLAAALGQLGERVD